jgi:hypothetical protein
MTTTHRVEPLVVSPAQAQVMLDCGTTYFYEILPELESYLEGRHRKITVASIKARIARKLEESQSGEDTSRPSVDPLRVRQRQEAREEGAEAVALGGPSTSENAARLLAARQPPRRRRNSSEPALKALSAAEAPSRAMPTKRCGHHRNRRGRKDSQHSPGLAARAPAQCKEAHHARAQLK